jgi:predicted  nucleic acid-binding Zn-ribbon protein
MRMRRAERLFELQKTDLALDAARRRVREIDARLTESEALRSARKSDRDLHERLAQLHARSKDLELQSTTLDDKIKSVDDRLYGGAVKNPKELSDLQMDAASLRRQKSALDDKLLEAILDLEQTEQDYQAAHAELARVEEDWQTDQSALTDERARLAGQIAAFETERASQRTNLPPPDLTVYDQLRKTKHGQVVAPVEDNVCGACGVQPSANKLTHLQRDDELIACGNCERILLDQS